MTVIYLTHSQTTTRSDVSNFRLAQLWQDTREAHGLQLPACLLACAFTTTLIFRWICHSQHQVLRRPRCDHN